MAGLKPPGPLVINYSWPDQGTYDPDRLRHAWPATVAALPIGARITGEVIARQPFGVFVRVDGVPDAVGLAELASMPRDAAPPGNGTPVTGEVIWHAEHNHQIKLRLLADPAATADQPPSAPTQALRMMSGPVHVDHVFINFANRTYQWVDIHRFHLPESIGEDATILAMLISHEQFGNDYATRPGDNPERHGPYWRDRITPDCFDPTDAAAAERHLRAWAEQIAPVPDHLQPELHRELYQPLHAADRLYQLRDLGRGAFHDWGGVHNEFHELVVINRTNRTVALVVAADD